MTPLQSENISVRGLKRSSSADGKPSQLDSFDARSECRRSRIVAFINSEAPYKLLEIQLLELTAFFPLGDEDFLGVNGEQGLVRSALLKLPGK
jgi:hypothetical protein